jgi:hypothetical protein
MDQILKAGKETCQHLPLVFTSIRQTLKNDKIDEKPSELRELFRDNMRDLSSILSESPYIRDGSENEIDHKVNK